MKRLMLFAFVFTLLRPVWGQILTEKNPPEHIKTIIFKTSADDKNQFPLVRQQQPFTLQFDDLTAQEATYYYKITHCDFNWHPSSLLKSEYIKGMDEQPIQPESNSYATLQPYSHYRLTLPNDLTKITLTGNYLLSVIDNYGNEVFSRRFVVYNPLVGVLAEVKRSRDLQYFDTKQVVQFSVKEQDIRLNDPKTSVNVAILQNYRWDNAITSLKPQYVMGNELIYRYDSEARFDASNEFLYFDSKDLRAASTGILRIEQNQLFEHYLFTNTSRSHKVYTYFPDINGDFLVNTINGSNPTNEADYVWVHFSLEPQSFYANKEVYVYGRFSNYQLDDAYRLHYNEKTGLFHGKALLKQGFYNYNFATKNANGADFNEISGNFQQTENSYLILVYYRQPGALYDEVIGVGSANGANITK
ncbi:DUF5103 domain-containing protein [Capnocytophaga sp.]|uniref:type IX secretion system plug protein n=1 Tax=Capnocytophaga sp. TaxID=44737 RepID=UPI0026DA825E|nr:DUF5103 domain-containing protein [Capnocytophaga sp.]MDO5104489.1 DUF5103 domain-containing protein [Capnocytophaga sp.]